MPNSSDIPPLSDSTDLPGLHSNGTHGQPRRPQPAPLELTDPEVWEAGPDPFDPEALRLAPDDAQGLGVKKALLSVPVRKPAKEWFIRTHPEDEYRLATTVIELKETRELYLVAPHLRPALVDETTLSIHLLLTAISRQSVLFLWPVRLPAPDGKQSEWARSALEAADLARQKWVRIQANMTLGAYSVTYTDHLSGPEWPDLPFREILRIAFKDRYINALDHPVLRQLRGEA